MHAVGKSPSPKFVKSPKQLQVLSFLSWNAYNTQKNPFVLGLRPDPMHWGANNAPRPLANSWGSATDTAAGASGSSPDPLAGSTPQAARFPPKIRWSRINTDFTHSDVRRQENELQSE